MIEELLKKNHLSIYQCSKVSGIPYTTLFELVHNEKRVENVSASTLYKLSKVLNVTMEDILSSYVGK